MIKQKIIAYSIFRCNYLYRWAMCQKLPVNGFKWKNNTSKFNETS